MAGLRLLLRVAGAALLAAVAWVHADLWLDGYRDIPTIGWLFALDVVGAAVLAVRARPVRSGSRRRIQRNAWVLLAEVAPEFGEWATFFAAGAAQRAAAEAGLERAVTTREADDLVRAVDTFYTQVEASLRLSTTPAFTATTDPQSVLTQPWMQAS